MTLPGDIALDKLLRWNEDISLSGSLPCLVLKLAFWHTNIVLAGVTCKTFAQDQNLKSFTRIAFVRSNQRNVCQFPPVQKCWGCLGRLALFYHNRNPVSDLPKGTESWFQKTHPSFIAHTCTKTLRGVFCIYTFAIFSASYSTHFSKIPSWHKHTGLEARPWCRMAPFQGSQLTATENLTYIYLLVLGHPTALCKTLKSHLHHWSQTCKGSLYFNCTPIECIESLLLLCMGGEVEEGKRDIYSFIFYFFLRGAMWFLLYDYSPARCDLLGIFKKESDTATKREVGGELS